MRVRSHIRLGIAALAVAGIAAFALWPETAAVDIATVVEGPMTVTVDEDGETRVRDRFVVSAPVTGVLQRVALEPGDAVARDRTVVARLTPLEPALLDARTRIELTAAAGAARAVLDTARAERDRAESAAIRARGSARRQRTLHAAGAVSLDDLEQAETVQRAADGALRAADAAVARAQYEVQTAAARLRTPQAGGPAIAIRAPADGVVLRRFRESASVIAAGEPILEVGGARALEVVCDVLSTDAAAVTPETRAILTARDGERIDARVRRVEPSGFRKVSALGVDEQRVNVILDPLPGNGVWAAVGDGYRVDVSLVVWESERSIKVPVGALFRRGDAWGVFVADSGRARLRMVRVAHRNNDEADIVEGLRAGDQVVLHPPDTLADGARIRPLTR